MFRFALLRTALFTLLIGFSLLGASARAAGTNDKPCPTHRSKAALELRALAPGTVVELLDERGQVIAAVEAAASAARLPLGGLPAGNYTVRVGADVARQFAIRFNGQRVTGTVTSAESTASAALPTAGH